MLLWLWSALCYQHPTLPELRAIPNAAPFCHIFLVLYWE